MKVYAVPGRLIRDPRTMLRVTDAGLEVPDFDPWWNGRLADGDISKSPPASQVAASKLAQDEAAVATAEARLAADTAAEHVA
jgi:hypothetical protein